MWGCERPELLITETFASHDRRTMIRAPTTGISKKTTDTPPNNDPDFDQVRRPQGTLVVELFNPWSSAEAPLGDLHEVVSNPPPVWQSGGFESGSASGCSTRSGLACVAFGSVEARIACGYDDKSPRCSTAAGCDRSGRVFHYQSEHCYHGSRLQTAVLCIAAKAASAESLRTGGPSVSSQVDTRAAPAVTYLGRRDTSQDMANDQEESVSAADSVR